MNENTGSVEDGSFKSSKLGTKIFWDTFYSKELQNFLENKDDEGEIWFGQIRMLKVVKFLLKEESVQRNSRILDIGCGNGAFLLEMAEEGYTNLHGIDYSDTAVKLSESIAVEHKKHVTYTQADFLDISTLMAGISVKKYNVCHDKGTYDAISLRRNDSEQARQLYIINLKEIMETGGIFIITSCNWTLEEIKSQFSADFSFVCHLPAPKLQYGGRSGTTVATAVFNKT